MADAMRRRDVLLKVTVLLLALVGAAVFNLTSQVTGNRTATYESRSVGCRMLVAHGFELKPGDPCNNPQVLRYYDPDAIVPAATARDATTNRRLVCRVLALLHESDPACQGL